MLSVPVGINGQPGLFYPFSLRFLPVLLYKEKTSKSDSVLWLMCRSINLDA